ncbi:MAG: DUF4185 domain-containing protein [Clostridia bacterium]|nr:DUF4185 domain-containing protein [Clostridia bacterium]
MKNFKRIICMLSSLIMTVGCFAFIGCGPDQPKGIDFATYKESQKAPTIENDDLEYIPTFNPAEVIGSFICDNDKAGNDTLKRFFVGGTDLGLSINVKSQGDPYTLLLFGDTFPAQNCRGEWRCGVVAKSQDYNLENNIILNSFWTKDGFKTETNREEGEMADAIIFSLGDTENQGETTKIYTGGCEVNGVIYAFYVSRHEQTEKPSRPNYNNYGGCIKSLDGGTTWERVWDLTWANHGLSPAHYEWLNSDPTTRDPGFLSTPEGDLAWNAGYFHPEFGYDDRNTNATNPKWSGTHAVYIQELVNQEIIGFSAGYNVADENNMVNGVDMDINKRVGFHFTQIYPLVAGDGYVYMFGRGGYRSSGVALARVKEENIEVFAEYEYLTSKENGGVWEKGIEHADDVVMVEERNLSNMSVVYNDYINKWVMSYLDCSEGSGAPLVIAYSDDLLNWSEPVTLLTNSGETKNLYGGYLNDMWVENFGQTYYFVYSRWDKNQPVYRSYIAKATVDRTLVQE